jgi:hypothetical protein
MPTVKVFAPQLSGTTGLALWLRKTSDQSLVNAGGDALTETSTSGWFIADVAETWTERLSAAVIDADGLVPQSGWLGVGETIVADVLTGAAELDSGALDPVLAAIEEIAAGGLTDAQALLLTQIGQRTAQIVGARLSVVGAVTPAGEISLIVGSDYVSAINSSLTRTITDAGAVLHAKLTAGALSQLVFRASPGSRSSLERKITGSISAVSHSAGVTSVTIVIDRDDIPNGPYGDSWKYQIWRETDTLVSPPLVEGALLLDWRV